MGFSARSCPILKLEAAQVRTRIVTTIAYAPGKFKMPRIASRLARMIAADVYHTLVLLEYHCRECHAISRQLLPNLLLPPPAGHHLTARVRGNMSRRLENRVRSGYYHSSWPIENIIDFSLMIRNFNASYLCWVWAISRASR